MTLVENKVNAADGEKEAEEAAPPAAAEENPISDNDEGVGLLDEEDENNAPFQAVIEEWSGGTSVHGVALAFARSDYRLWYRLIWAGLVVSSCCLMLWQITNLFRQYRDYAVITDTQVIVPDEPLEFPEITVCNTNKYQNWKMSDAAIEHPASEEEVNMISQDLETFVLYSNFNGRDHIVPNETWTPYMTDDGRCWQFRTDERVVRPGYEGGLNIYLFLEQYFYTDDTGIAAVHIFVQAPGTVINPQVPYYSAAPGQLTELRIKKTIFQRERTAPWARCYSQAPIYTQEQCRRNCLYQIIRDECQCKLLGDRLEGEDLRLCYSEPEQDAECEDQLNVTIRTKKILEECESEQARESSQCTVPPCVETEYEVDTVGSAFSQTLYSTVRDGFNITDELFEQNFVGVHINFDRIRYEKLTESKEMTRAQLMANIGGSMGLFLGISFLSVWEIFGDLIGMRLIPRFWGNRHIRGMGGVRS
mmetsp:Transcript_4349/g.11949  ORF Transcript_4349/g.11949 Transcript_4349/m.11949 type:complete len:476 (-) Transcript_4349:404-1831(-)